MERLEEYVSRKFKPGFEWLQEIESPLTKDMQEYGFLNIDIQETEKYGKVIILPGYRFREAFGEWCFVAEEYKVFIIPYSDSLYNYLVPDEMFFPLSEETGLEVNMYDFMPLFHPDGGLEQHIEERGNLYIHKSLMKE